MKCQPAGRATSRLWRGRFRGGDEPRRTQLANVAQRGAVSGDWTDLVLPASKLAENIVRRYSPIWYNTQCYEAA